MTTLGIILFLIASAMSLVGAVMLIVAGFRESLPWGLVVTFVPFGVLVFAFKFWPQAKRGFLISLAGTVLGPVAAIMWMSGAVAGMGEQMATEMAREMEQERARQAASAQTGGETLAGIPSQQPGNRPDESRREPRVPQAAQPATQAAAPSEPGDEPGAGAGPGLPINPLDSFSVDEAESAAESTAVVGRTIPLSSAGGHVGERLEFVRKDGRIFSAELVEVGDGQLRVRRDVPGGTMVYPVPSRNIAKLRQLDSGSRR